MVIPKVYDSRTGTEITSWYWNNTITNTEQHFAAASSRKVACYGPLLSDLACTGLFFEVVTIEVGCLGHFLPSTISNLCRVCHLQKCSIRSIFEQAA